MVVFASTPPLTRTNLIRALGIGFLLLGLLVLIPGSPLSLDRIWLVAPRFQGKTANEWLRLLEDGDSTQKVQSLEALIQLPTHLAGGGLLISRQLDSNQPEPVRILASLWLFKAESLAPEVLPSLIEALKDEDPQVRANVSRALLRMGTQAAAAVPNLIQEVSRPIHQEYSVYTATTQETLILVLGKALSGGEGKGLSKQAWDEGLQTLGRLVESGSTQDIKNAAIRALGWVGPPALPMADRIRKTASQEFWPFKEDARESLQAIGIDWDPSREILKAEQLILPEAERKTIWSIEHHGNLLGKFGFGPFCKALSNQDPTQLKSLLAPGFRFVRRLESASRGETRPEFSILRQDEGPGLPEQGIEPFVEQLMGQRAHFGKGLVQAKFGVLGIGPAQKDRWDGPWEVRCQLRLHGNDPAKGPIEVISHWRLVLEKPTRERLEKGAWLLRAEIMDQMVGKAKRPLFREVASERGLSAAGLYDHWEGGRFVSWTGGAFVCDFDHDGWLDLLVTDLQGGALYRGGPGGKMTDVTRSLGLETYLSQALAAAWVDLDQDGWEDLILGHVVLQNDQGKRFLDKTEVTRPKFPEDFTNILVADYDRDGLPDLYFSRTGKPGINSWLEGRSDDHRTNVLFRNKGKWKFENTTEKAGVGANHFSTFCAVWFDANNDGWPDLHSPNEFGDGTLFLNQKDGTFKAATLGAPPVDFGTMGLAAGDFNNDGNIDLYCANMYSKAGSRVIGNLPAGAFPQPIVDKMRRFVAGSQLHLNQGQGVFQQVGQTMKVHGVGWAYGPALADLDNDGWLDIYATAGYCSRDRNEPDG